MKIRMVNVFNLKGQLVCQVSNRVTSIGASKAAGFTVHYAFRDGRGCWIQKA